MRAIIILLIICAGGYYWHSRREAHEALEALKSQQKSIESSIGDRQKALAVLRAKVEPLREAKAAMSGPGGSPEELEKAVDQLRADLKDAASRLEAAEDSFLESLTALRDFAKTQPIPAIKLASGEELKECKISNFGEGFVKIDHHEGVSKLEAEDLPAGWSEKYFLHYVSRHEQSVNKEINDKVTETVLSEADLKKLDLANLDNKIKEVKDQLMALSLNVRDARRRADQMVRNAYRVQLESGPRAGAANARRSEMFAQAKAIEAAGEQTRGRYIALRKQLQALERQRLELRKKKVAPAAEPTPQ
jgi:hypothetical protein